MSIGGEGGSSSDALDALRPVNFLLEAIQELLKQAGIMHDALPSCFGEYGVQVLDITANNGNKVSQNLVTCLYQTKLAGRCRPVSITWCKSLMGQGLSVNIDVEQHLCKINMKPWLFWKKQGFKSFEVDGKKVEVYWDLSSAKYSCGPVPQEGFFVAVVTEGEVVLLLGDMCDEAFKKSRARPALIEAILISRSEHIFGKKYHATKVQFGEGGQAHDIVIDCQTGPTSEPRLYIRIDRQVVVQVKHLMWKFRGNQTIIVDGNPVEVFWDVHNWLFNPSLGHAVFMFQTCLSSEKPWLKEVAACSSVLQWPGTYSFKDKETSSPSGFSLLLYAWKSE